MIYSFNVKEDFFLELKNNSTYSEAETILNFFHELLYNRENLFYFDNRKIISNIKLPSGVNSIIIKELQTLLSRYIRPAEKVHNIEVDFIFSNIKSKSNRQTNITSSEILKSRTEITKKIKDLTPNKWLPNANIPQNQLKKDMEIKLKRIFKYSDKIYIVDAYLPDHLAENISSHVKSYENSFEFFSNLTNNIKSIEFYNGIKVNLLNKKKITKIQIEERLKRFYKIFKNHKSPVFVKADKTKEHKAMYERMFITYLDEINIGIFTVERGLNVLTQDSKTTHGRKIIKQDLDWTQTKLDAWAENVEESSNFISFNTSEIN